MKHQITTTVTGNNWETVMGCKFANAIIAQLVMQDTKTITYDGGKKYVRDDYGKDMARIEQEGNTITLTSYDNGGWKMNCGSQEDTKAALEDIAKSWQVREGIYLPAMQYFEAGAKAFNERQRKSSDQHDEDAKILECRIEELERKLDACQSLLDSTKNQQGETNKDIFDCLNVDSDQIRGLWKDLFLHKEKSLHFPDRKGRQ